ncbi:MAG TPA: biliverdin-producing heme oxygenase [Kofleriaceae bacterium]
MDLRRLKVETLDLHREAERHVRIFDADATEETYARYLERLLGVHAPMEAAFVAHADLARVGFDPARRRRADLLCADLVSLGKDPAKAPTCASLPDIADLSRALGAAYVLEGSALGGPFVIAKVRYAVPTRYLRGYGRDTGPLWKRFGAIVAAEVADAEACVAAARELFAALIGWLEAT